MQFHAINAINRNRKLQTSQRRSFLNQPREIKLPKGNRHQDKSDRTRYLLRKSTRAEFWLTLICLAG
ncbi:MAG: hypothetical protein AAFY91_15920, partial [Bacteroidota bacterium]